MSNNYPVPVRYSASHEPFVRQHAKGTAKTHPNAIALDDRAAKEHRVKWIMAGLCGLADTYMASTLTPGDTRYRQGRLILHEGEIIGHSKSGQYRTFLAWQTKETTEGLLYQKNGLYLLPRSTFDEVTQGELAGWPYVEVPSLLLFPGRHARPKVSGPLQRESERVMQLYASQK